MSRQQQFLDVVDRDEAERRFHGALRLAPLGEDVLGIVDALGRVASREIFSPVDVPSFDRSNLDGFAVRAADTFGAVEEKPKLLRLRREVVPTGVAPRGEVSTGDAMAIATGAMLPRGADAVVMVEHTDVDAGNGDGVDDRLLVHKSVTPGCGVSFAGTDITNGESVVRPGELLTSRETGVLAAIGVDRLWVWRPVKVAVISTGDELIEPGQEMRPGLVYDSNAQILCDSIRELGAEPWRLGIVGDNLDALRDALTRALEQADVVLLSGGTSKGEGDLCYRAVSELRDPGIVAHGVALKPGKPICLAASGQKPVVILPGFPTSAIFTFHEFVAPVIRALGGRPADSRSVRAAQMAVKVNSEIGRTEYLLVGLVESPGDGRESGDASAPLVAFPMGKGSGSVTAFSRADGFVTISRHEEIIEAGRLVEVTLLGRDWRPADLVVIGSHCIGLDYLLGQLQQRGFRTKFLAVGSTAGLNAARRGECDLAGIHLMDPESGEYNRPFLTPEITLVAGYGRRQGIVHRLDDDRFRGTAREVLQRLKPFDDCRMVNRNQGSGTRVLIDRLLEGDQPPGYAVQARSHNAVAAAVAQRRADWGVAIAPVAARAKLGFLPLEQEQFDFLLPRRRQHRPAVKAFVKLLNDPAVRRHLAAIGFTK